MRRSGRGREAATGTSVGSLGRAFFAVRKRLAQQLLRKPEFVVLEAFPPGHGHHGPEKLQLHKSTETNLVG